MLGKAARLARRITVLTGANQSGGSRTIAIGNIRGHSHEQRIALLMPEAGVSGRVN
jgi:hypothetical protein